MRFFQNFICHAACYICIHVFAYYVEFERFALCTQPFKAKLPKPLLCFVAPQIYVFLGHILPHILPHILHHPTTHPTRTTHPKKHPTTPATHPTLPHHTFTTSHHMHHVSHGMSLAKLLVKIAEMTTVTHPRNQRVTICASRDRPQDVGSCGNAVQWWAAYFTVLVMLGVVACCRWMFGTLYPWIKIMQTHAKLCRAVAHTTGILAIYYILYVPDWYWLLLYMLTLALALDICQPLAIAFARDSAPPFVFICLYSRVPYAALWEHGKPCFRLFVW